MIDRPTRDHYAVLLRHFIAGQMTNFQYEDKFDNISITLGGADPAVLEIFQAMWYTYDDICQHTMTGDHAFRGPNRETAIRFILFLYSDVPYEWPTVKLSGCLFNLLTLGLYGKMKRRKSSRNSGDDTVWPFFRREDYESARKNPRLLNAHRQTPAVADSAGGKITEP